MNLRHLDYLRLVVEQGSFAAAARAAGVSQPAVSQALQRLQAAVGAPLLQRQGRRSVPTPYARRLASGASGLARQVAALHEAPAGPAPDVLRAGLTATAALLCGPVLHDAWRANRPQRRLVLSGGDEGSLLRALQRHELDLVIAARPRGDLPPGVVGEPLYRLQPRVHARRAHPARAATSLAELRGHAWAQVEPSVRGPVDLLAEALRVRRLPAPRVAVACADYASLLALLPQADLLAVLPHPALLTDDLARQLPPLRLRETLPLYEAWLLRTSASQRRTEPVAERLRTARQDSPPR